MSFIQVFKIVLWTIESSLPYWSSRLEVSRAFGENSCMFISGRLGTLLTPNSVCSAKGLIWISSAECQPLCFTPYEARLSQSREEACILAWKLDAAVPDKQSGCQRPLPGARGMWKILAAMAVAMMVAVCYLHISGYFPNPTGWDCLILLAHSGLCEGRHCRPQNILSTWNGNGTQSKTSVWWFSILSRSPLHSLPISSEHSCWLAVSPKGAEWNSQGLQKAASFLK